MISIISDHIAAAKRRLIQQYKGRPNFGAVVEASVQEWQVIEDAGHLLNTNRSIDSSTGVQLDLIGVIVGLTREPGQSNDDYRVLLKSRISQNVSQGEPERLIDIFKVLSMANLVLFEELFPAAVGFGSEVSFPDQGAVNALFENLEKTGAAGVRVDRIVSFDPTEAFAFAGNLPGLGFGTLADAGVGGKLAHLNEAVYPFAFAGDNPNYRGFGTLHDVLVGGSFLT